MKKGWPLWLMLSLAILIIICGVLIAFNPGKFWGVVNVLLGIALVFAGISAMINAIKNQKSPYVSFLFIIGILILILGFTLIGAKEVNFVGKLMIWMFALWALMRGGMLLFFGIQNKDSMPLRWGICLLGGLLIILAIMTAISSGEMADLVGICIGISTILDGISLLFFAIKGGSVQTIQAQIISESNQNEIAQGDVVITESTVITNNPESQNQ